MLGNLKGYKKFLINKPMPASPVRRWFFNSEEEF